MKRFNVVLIISIVVAIIGCNKKEPVSLAQFDQNISTKNSWQYDMNYKMKYFSDDEDTLDYNSNVILIKKESDSIFGGSIWIDNDSIDRFYDLEHLYIINHKKEKITRFFPHKGQEFAITGNTISGVLNSYFIKTKGLARYESDSTKTLTIVDTVLNDNKRKGFKVNLGDDGGFINHTKDFYFDKDNNLKDIYYSVEFQDEQQYNEWHFSNEQYNHIDLSDLKARFKNYADQYIIEDFKERSQEDMEPLANGVQTPAFKGFHYQLQDSVSLDEFDSKYIILDFWYKDCFPCIEAIPSLNLLRSKYAVEDLLILGINPIDNPEKSKEKLDRFIENNEMNYPSIFTDRQVPNDYKVFAYPTFYILDKERKVLYSKIGHSEKNESEIDSLLSQLIK